MSYSYANMIPRSFTLKSQFLEKIRDGTVVLWEHSTASLLLFFGYLNSKDKIGKINLNYDYLEAAIERCSQKKMFWKYAANSQEKRPCRSKISIKLESNFIEITLGHGCSPVNLLHIFRAPFLKNTSGRLLLNIASDRGLEFLKT